MKPLVLESWMLLFRMEWIMRLGKFQMLYRTVQLEPARSIHSCMQMTREDLCRAMDYACVLYFKHVLCLQRSAATTILLRRHGFAASLVIGAKLLPFRSHAWVECGGEVVNDKPYMRTIYQVLESC